MEFGCRGTEQDLQLDERFLERNPEDKVQTSLAPRRRTVARTRQTEQIRQRSVVRRQRRLVWFVQPPGIKRRFSIFCGICIDIDEQGHI